MVERRIGVDVGGTKIEAILIEDGGREQERVRVPTPGDYPTALQAIVSLVFELERRHGSATVGVGMPGTVVPRTGLVKNANREWLNGQRFQRDLAELLSREVRCANDADCFAASEARDGAAKGVHIVFAVILGTGCGAGIAIDGFPHVGAGGIAGEWGHNSLPWPTVDEFPGPDCYCGKQGCLEQWVSGPGLEADFRQQGGDTARSAADIARAAAAGNAQATAAIARFENRLARGLASVVNVIDPDVIVLGGGLSNIERLYESLPTLVPDFVFGRECATPIRRAHHGDSSGVRGAALLWPT
jgi:fructokinase